MGNTFYVVGAANGSVPLLETTSLVHAVQFAEAYTQNGFGAYRKIWVELYADEGSTTLHTWGNPKFA